MFEVHNNKPSRDDLRPVARVLENALKDMMRYQLPRTDSLCYDIAAIGYSQLEAVDHIFPPPRLEGPRAKLAAQVCDYCVSRATCTQAVQAEAS